MLRSFPPFPSPNPATMNQSPFENMPIIPSPPSSSSSSSVSSPRSTPSTPASPTAGSTTSSIVGSTTNSGGSQGRPRSRSTARKCAPSHSRIVKRDSGTSSKSTSSSEPHTPPTTPPLETTSTTSTTAIKVVEKDVSIKTAHGETGVVKKKIVRAHHYEDAVRIACGAWGDSNSASHSPNPVGAAGVPGAGQHKKKTVSWDAKVPA